MTSTPAGGRHFYSDNLAGTHPAVLQALAAANVGHVLAYGNDPLTELAQAKVCELFGGDGVEARWMTAWDTTEQDVDHFAATVRRILSY